MLGLRASPELRERIERWAAKQDDGILLSEAIRRLVELGLTVPAARKAKRGQITSQATHDSHAERAAHDYIDNALKHEHEDVRADRKKRLTTMPGGAKRR